MSSQAFDTTFRLFQMVHCVEDWEASFPRHMMVFFVMLISILQLLSFAGLKQTAFRKSHFEEMHPINPAYFQLWRNMVL